MVIGREQHNFINNNAGCNWPLKSRACRLTAGFMSICPQIRVSDDSGSLRLACGQQVNTPVVVAFYNKGFIKHTVYSIDIVCTVHLILSG